MNLTIKNHLYQSILQNKWVNITYKNKQGILTSYYIGIKDVDINKGLIFCDIFNPYILDEIKDEVYIYFDRIEKASVLENTFYQTPPELIKKVAQDENVGKYFEVINFDNNILSYLYDAYRYDTDPYLKETLMIDDIDIHTLSKNEKYKLSDEQFVLILDKLFKKNYEKAESNNRFVDLAINKFSIDIKDKQYVVAYKSLFLDFKNKTLVISPKSHINKSFLISEDKRVTLGKYLNVSTDEFCAKFDAYEEEYINMIKDNFQDNEIVNTRPVLFIVERQCLKGVGEALDSINDLDNENKLPIPIKSFFGRNLNRISQKEVDLVVFDKKKVNIDQLRVIYNSLINKVTFVKGPPGTGKTETIFNVILSSYVNDKKILICSNNNHPLDDIYDKLMGNLSVKIKGKDENIYLPVIRLGNAEEIKNSIFKLKELLSFVNKFKKNIKESLTNKTKNKTLSNFSRLKEAIFDYEKKIEIKENIKNLEKIKDFSNIERINNGIEKQITKYRIDLNTYAKQKDSDILDLAISASEDNKFKTYLYYSSLLKLLKLTNPKNNLLREIIEKEDIEEAYKSLVKYLKEDTNLRNFIEIFPIIICTNLSSEKLGSPIPQFDLVIMDEAGQCNIASSLISIIRGGSLVLVGDTNQLQPVTVIEEPLNNSLRIRYGVGEEYDYVKNSILSTMMRKDNNAKNILLRYHYRCGNKIASFVNHRFYQDQLELLNKNSGELVFCSVKNTPNPNQRNSYIEEATAISNIIKENKYRNVGIITPFVSQASLINECLAKEGISDVKAGTIHTLQGSEKDVIIMSIALSYKTSQKTMDWIKNNHELINVAVTRAKEKFIFVGDKLAIDKLSINDTNNDIKLLSDYVYKNGEIHVPQSDTVMIYDFSNGSKNEKDFFDTIKPYFNRRDSKFRIIRNVLVKEAIKDIDKDDLDKCGKKEFDVIVQVSLENKNRYNTIVVFEIDGGEHIGSNKQASYDRTKEQIASKYGIKLIRIANSAVKDYESIINIFEFVIKGIKDYEQLSLFNDN